MLNKMGKKLGHKDGGFTIIEVLIVLAIAGLILAIVLIAIPQLQRNQRNTSRRDVASRIVTEINNYAGNNNGDYPLPVNTGSNTRNFGTPATAGFFERYLGCTPSATPATCTTNIDDPRTGEPVGTGSDGGTNLSTDSPLSAGGAPGTVAGSIAYGTGIVCDGETVVAGSNRNFAFVMRLEGGAIYCLDNQ